MSRIGRMGESGAGPPGLPAYAVPAVLVDHTAQVVWWNEAMAPYSSLFEAADPMGEPAAGPSSTDVAARALLQDILAEVVQAPTEGGLVSRLVIHLDERPMSAVALPTPSFAPQTVGRNPHDLAETDDEGRRPDRPLVGSDETADVEEASADAPAWLVLFLPLQHPGASGSNNEEDWDLLTPVERELVRHIAAGHTVRQASAALRVSYHTGRKYLQTIYRKVGVNRQAELIARLGRRPPNEPKGPR